MYEKKMLGLDEADRIVNAIVEHVRNEKGVPISIAVVDYRGDLIKFVRMDGASWNTARVAQAKAYSAAKFRRNTTAVLEWMNQMKIQLADWADPNVTSIGGGVCIWDEQASPRTVIGAVAVSGFPQPEVDEQYANLGIAAMG
ncbi:MAG: heme-binding protein [Dehalococcoidia bacterium]|nr:heme-binding protein [Dehalococcoidia bacterium]